jgi:hypothetical protein
MKEIKMQSNVDQPQVGGIHISVWPDKKQIEIWTDRGKSFVVQGDKAEEFARLMRTELCDPLLS